MDDETPKTMRRLHSLLVLVALTVVVLAISPTSPGDFDAAITELEALRKAEWEAGYPYALAYREIPEREERERHFVDHLKWIGVRIRLDQITEQLTPLAILHPESEKGVHYSRTEIDQMVLSNLDSQLAAMPKSHDFRFVVPTKAGFSEMLENMTHGSIRRSLPNLRWILYLLNDRNLPKDPNLLNNLNLLNDRNLPKDPNLLKNLNLLNDPNLLEKLNLLNDPNLPENLNLLNLLNDPNLTKDPNLLKNLNLPNLLEKLILPNLLEKLNLLNDPNLPKNLNFLKSQMIQLQTANRYELQRLTMKAVKGIGNIYELGYSVEFAPIHGSGHSGQSGTIAASVVPVSVQSYAEWLRNSQETAHLIGTDSKGRSVWFPELKRFWADVQSSSVESAHVKLLVKRSKSENAMQVELFGLTVRGSFAIFASVVSVLSLQLYLLAHLTHVTRGTGLAQELQEFPWIGLYAGYLSRFLTVITLWGLPVFALAFTAWQFRMGYWLVAALAIASGVLGALNVWFLLGLTKKE